MGNRVSLREVAAAADVSVSTASLALAGHVRISPATATRVRAAAAALGYVRDQTQSSNAANRFRHGGKPALVAAWVNSPLVITRLQHHAAEMGMCIHHLPQHVRQKTDAPPATATPPTASMLADLGATALIVECRGVDAPLLANLGLPIVRLSDEGDGPLYGDVIETCEWWTASTQAIAHVRSAGYHRPVGVMINAQPPHWHDDVRAAAFRAQGIPVITWDHHDASLRHFVQLHQPDAVIGLSIHVLHALNRLGLGLPFAALLTFDLPWHRHCAGWREDADRQARTTLELIEQRLRYGERPPYRIIVPPLWHAGKSLPPARDATTRKA